MKAVACLDGGWIRTHKRTISTNVEVRPAKKSTDAAEKQRAENKSSSWQMSTNGDGLVDVGRGGGRSSRDVRDHYISNRAIWPR